MEPTDFKNVIVENIHLVFMTFHNRIFVVFVFDKISKGMLVTIEKEPSEYFQRLHFWNQWVPLIKTQCRVRYLLDFDLKIRSGQVCNTMAKVVLWSSLYFSAWDQVGYNPAWQKIYFKHLLFQSRLQSKSTTNNKKFRNNGLTQLNKIILFIESTHTT